MHVWYIDVTLKGKKSIIDDLAPTLAISGHESAIYGLPIMEAGARGYVMKRYIQQLLPAVRQLLAGNTYLSKDK